MLLLLRSYGRDAEVVAASFFFTVVIFGFLSLVVSWPSVARRFKSSRLLNARQPYSLPARIGNENLLISKTMRAGATQ
jgi:hypothetical protein